MRLALARHDATLRRVVERHGGRVFKNTGDGICAVFDSAGDAVVAAVEAQRAFASPAEQTAADTVSLRIRVAIHHGEAEERDGDFFGPPLNRTARLVDAAHGDQIVVSLAAREAARGALSGVTFLELGEHVLRDLPTPEAVFQVVAPGLPSEFPPLDTGEAAAPAEASTGAGGAEPALRAYVLGRFELVLRGRSVPESAWSRHKARQLLACLLVRPHHRMTREEALDLFWPDSDPESAGTNLRTARQDVRDALRRVGLGAGEDPIPPDRHLVALRMDGGIWVDADEFERLIGEAQTAADRLALMERADSLYRGHLLPDEAYEPWVADPREHLKRLWVDLQMQLARVREERGGLDAAAAGLQQVLDEDPCDERAARELMALLARTGRRADALRLYRQVVQALRNELQAEPSPATVELLKRINEGEAPPAVATAALVPEAAHADYVCSHPFPAPGRLVGRGGELARLAPLLERGRHAGVVAFLGAPAGTGKSTLAGALVRQARAAGVLCLAGGSYDQEAAAPLGPFRDALSDYLLAQTPERLRADLAGLGTDLALVVPELRYHLGLADPGAPTRQVDAGRLFAAVHGLIRILVERGPVLLCLEDLHAADEASLELIWYLARQTRRLPVTLLGTYRTEDAPPGHPLARRISDLAREHLAHQVILEQLGREDTARLAASLLDGPASEHLADSLYRTTEGNPLFVEQLVLTMREQGQVDQRSGVWHRTAETQGEVPTIIREVIVQRLNRVSERCRGTLAMAAVLGQAVQHTVLAESLAPTDEDDLLSDLEEALSAQLLHETPTGYAFRHALLRDTVYWSLSGPRRMRLHARAGETLERLAGPRASELAAELAHHFTLAERLLEVRAKAIRYNLEAGRRAAALSAYRDALEHYRRACDLLEREGDGDPEARVTALGGRAYAEHQLAMWEPALASFRAALGATDDPLRRAGWRGSIAFTRQQIGDTVGAMQEVDAGLAELERATASTDAGFARSRLQFQKAFLLFVRGRFRDVLQLGEEILATAEALENSRALAWAHTALGMGRSGMGQIDDSIREYSLALAAAERSNNKVQTATAYSNLGLQHFRGGDFDTARHNLTAAMALYRQSASEGRAVLTLATLARLELAEGRLEAAWQAARHALGVANESGDRWEAECHDLLGAIHGLRLEWDEAEACYRRALEIRERVGHAAGMVESRLGLGLSLERSGRFEAAQLEYERARAIVAEVDPCPQAMATARHLGRLRLRQDDAGGLADLERAEQLAELMPRSIERRPTTIVLAWSKWRAGDAASAVMLAASARSEPTPVEIGLAARALGAALARATGNDEAAGDLGRAATELAERLGAPYWHEVVASVVARAGAERLGPADASEAVAV